MFLLFLELDLKSPSLGASPSFEKVCISMQQVHEEGFFRKLEQNYPG
jgi:hypothetical protein